VSPIVVVKFVELSLICAQMSKHSDSVAAKIFKDIQPFLVQIGKSLTKADSNLSLPRRTWTRWKSPGYKPSPDKISETARLVWTIINSKEGERIRESVLAVIKRAVPSAPVESWKTPQEIGVWFYTLASEPDATETQNPGSKTTRASVGRQTQPGDGPCNPFTWRGAISDPGAFFGRKNQLRRIRDSLLNRQSLQVVASRRMGKSSLLLKIGDALGKWLPSASFAYVDMSDAAVHTKAGWLRRVSKDLGWPSVARGDSDFSDNMRRVAKGGSRLVLCLDEFENFTDLRSEFDRGFFRNLRACAQLPVKQGGLSIITASQDKLSALCERDPDISAFYNILSLLPLPLYTEDEAEEFVSLPQSGAPAFTREESSEILQFAQRHPLKLQIACWHAVEARITGISLPEATRLAQREADELLPRTK